MAHIYGSTNNPKDISKINSLIRKDVKRAKTERALDELHKKSLYLYTLSYSPSLIHKKNIKQIRARAVSEYSKTTKLINYKARRLKINKCYNSKIE